MQTAAHHLVRDVPTGSPDETVADALAGLRHRAWQSVEALYVLDEDARLIGRVALRELLVALPAARLADVMTADPPRATLQENQEHVAHKALRHGMPELPVVDGQGLFVGVVPPRAMLHVLRHEHVQDLHRLAGIAAEHVHTDFDDPPARRVRHRLPWLVVGLAGSMIAAKLMGGFEETLDAHVAVAFFVPGIVYIADAIGTQTEAIVVRGLSLARVPLSRLLWGEVGTGLLLGGALGALSVPLVGLGFGEWRLGVAVGVSVLAAGAAATSIGLLLPWALAQMGRDPAFGSGPLATIIQDVLSLVIYFAVVTALGL